VIVHLTRLFQQSPEFTRAHPKSLWEKANADALPQDRQRPYYHHAKIREIVKAARRRAHTITDLQASAPPKPVDIPEPTPAVEPRPDALQQIVEHFARTLIDAVVERVSARVTNEVCNSVNAAVNSLEAELVKQRLSHDSKPVERKKRVVLVGPLPRQASLLHKEFDTVIDLRIPDRDSTPPAQIASMCHSAEKVLSWVDFTPHHLENSIRNANPTVFERFKGGMEEMRDRLTSIAVNGA
jgi:hypothetical protein